ncbi:hypothetical protein G9O61_00g013250 [Vairimorpha ceranae]|nr:hypothetical protein G9O61_00g013250 [Vairimorpha ceranae]
MGRKKVRRAKIKKPRTILPLEKRFACPKCNQDSVSKGYAICTVCQAQFRCEANNLTNPIDIYSEWIDECNK